MDEPDHLKHTGASETSEQQDSPETSEQQDSPEEPNECYCRLLFSNTGLSELSLWSTNEFPNKSLKSKSSPSNSSQKPARRYFGYQTAADRYKFEHHDNIRQYMLDYNKAFLREPRSTKVHPLQYGGPYSRKLAPPYATAVKKSVRGTEPRRSNPDSMSSDVNEPQANMSSSNMIVMDNRIAEEPPTVTLYKSTPSSGRTSQLSLTTSSHSDPIIQSVEKKTPISATLIDKPVTDTISKQHTTLEINLTGRPRQRITYHKPSTLPHVKYQLPITTNGNNKSKSSTVSPQPKCNNEQLANKSYLGIQQFPTRAHLLPLTSNMNYSTPPGPARMIPQSDTTPRPHRRQRYVGELIKSLGASAIVPYISDKLNDLQSGQLPMSKAAFCDLNYIFTSKPG